LYEDLDEFGDGAFSFCWLGNLAPRAEGDALEDLADGGLDGRAIFGQSEVEGGAAAAALSWIGDGFTGGVVVVAELFPAQAWAGAAVTVGEDVAALVLFVLVRRR
jgi:hypothetical protein